jgi:hypothetical protein
MLLLHFTNYANQIEKDLSVFLNSVEMFASLDTIIDIVDMYLLFVSIMNETVLPKPAVGRHKLESPFKPELETWETSSILNITAVVSPVKIFLLKDHDRADSCALVVESAKVNTTVMIVTRVSECNAETDDLNISVVVDDLGLDIYNNVANLSSSSEIIAPFSLLYSMTISKDKISEAEMKSLSLCISDDVETKLKISNISLIQGILLRRLDPRRRLLSHNADGFGDYKEKDGKLFSASGKSDIKFGKSCGSLIIRKIVCKGLKHVEILGGKNDPFVRIDLKC